MSKMSQLHAHMSDLQQFQNPYPEPPEPDGFEEPDPATLAGRHPIDVCVRLVDLWKSDPESFSGPLRELVTDAEKVLAELPF